MAEEYVALAEVRDMLRVENSKRELLRSQKNAMTHAEGVSLSVDQAKELVAKLRELEFITPELAVKIADILPKYPGDVRAIFQKQRVGETPEMIQQVLDIVNPYL